MAKKNRRAGTHRRGVLYRPLYVLITIIAILFSLTVFFKVVHIEVTGAGVYPEEEIIETSGVQSGGSLFLLNSGKARAAILKTLPYVRDVKVSRKFPDTVRITVEESRAIAYIQKGGVYWLLDQDCRVLEEADAQRAEGLIWIKGLEPETMEIGREIEVLPEDSENKEYLTAVLRMLVEKGMNEQVSAMDAANSANLRFYYDERFLVKLGKLESLESKLEVLKIAVSQRSALDRGTMDLSSGNGAHYIPEQ